MSKTFSTSSSIAILLFGAAALLAQPKDNDPDSAANVRAAQEALTRAKILDIVGVTTEISGLTTDISGLVRDLGGRTTEFGIEIDVPADVLFDFDRHDIRPAAAAALTKIAELIRRHRDAPVEISGHTDGLGSDAHNVPLSQRRAQSVKTWLALNGKIESARMTAKGFGKSKPVASNTNPDGTDNPEGRQKNRRVQILIRTKHAG